MSKMMGAMKTLLGMGALALGLASAPAYALSVSPATADYTIAGAANCDASCMSTKTGIASLVELYKATPGDPVSEVGSAAPYYTTTFQFVQGQGNGFTITWDGPKYIECPSCVLYVKDGNLGGYAFLINSWNGKETITGSGFFPTKDSGSISHVSIFSTHRDPRNPPVPEPSTMLLLGSGLVGMAAWKRRKSS